MEFFDVSQFKIVNMSRWSTLSVSMDADTFLDLPLTESENYIANLFKVYYKAPSVFYNINVKVGDELTEDDFDSICNSLVTHIFERNMLVEERSPSDMKGLMNELPGGRYTLKYQVAHRINTNNLLMRNVASHLYRNRNINIRISTNNGQFIYEFIGVENTK